MLRWGQLVSFAAPSSNQRFCAAPIELPPEPLHVYIDYVRQRIVVLVPDMLGNVRAADDVAGAPREIFKERVFLGSQPQLARADPGAATARLEHQRSDCHPLRQQRPPASPDQRAQTGQQLAEIERLDEVVVGAAVEARDAR